MPHFGRLNEANACIKYLLACFHGGTLWLNDPIPVMVDIIFDIMGFPKVDEDLAQYFRGWDNDKRISQQLKERFGLQRDGRAYHIDSTYERSVCIGAHNLASKIIQKNRPVQCNSGVVDCAHKYIEGVKINWSLFLLNQLLEDVFFHLG